MIDVTCAIILNAERQVLVAQRSAVMSLPLKMEFPGGKVEPGETPEACLIREIKEELSLDIRLVEKLPANTHIYPGLSIKLIPFICEITGGVLELKEHAAGLWLNPEDLLALDWAAADVPVVKSYLNGLHKNPYLKIYAETERIILREMVMADNLAMFELDSDPEVHKYLGNNFIQTIEESENQIQFIRQQYIDNGIGRWAIVDKKTNLFVGWGGLKFMTTLVNGHIDYYEVGYRLLRKFWGQGFATESAKASVKYAFEELKLPAVYAMAHCENTASRHALQKIGLKITGQFIYEGIACDWFELTKEEWILWII